MKKIGLLLLSAVLCFVSCYDDSELQQSVTELEKRVVSLEQLCKEMNTNISSLQAIVDAIKDKDFVTGVTPIEKEGMTIGYTIKFTKSKPVTIYNGKDGDSPKVGVKKDADGNYYWTVNGEYLLDGGKKIKANGENGNDGIAPELKIENGKWFMKVGEGEWKEIGQATGDAFFKEVKVGEKEIVLTLADGQTLVLPMKTKMSITFDLGTTKIAAGETVSVPYKVEGVTSGIDIKAIGQNGWSAKVTQKTYTTGEIVVTAPNPLTNDEIIVIVSDREGQVIMSSLTWTPEDVVVGSVDAINVPYTAGEFTVAVETNCEFVLSFKDNAGEWLKEVKTKAMNEVEIKVAYTENETVAARTAKMVFSNKEGKVLFEIPVTQEMNKNFSLEFRHAGAAITGIAGEYVIPIKVNRITDWTAESNADWATVTKKENDYVLTVTENAGESRQAKLTIKATVGGNTLQDELALTQLVKAPVADLLDVTFNDDGTAKDVSPAKREITYIPGDLLKIEKQKDLNINAAIFSTSFGASINGSAYIFPDFVLREKFEDGYSMEAFVMCSVVPDGKESKAISSTADGGTALMINKGKHLSFLYNGNPEGKKAWRFVESDITPEPGRWYHLIGTWDQESGIARFYVDGKLEKETNFGPVKLYYSNLKENSYMTIGGNSGAGSSYEKPSLNGRWEGGVTMARIYSDALTKDQALSRGISLLPGKIAFQD